MSTASEPLIFWRYIASSLERLVGCLDGLDGAGLNWCPPAPEANSIYTLAIHALGNAEENILETLCGTPIGRDRAGEFAARGGDSAIVAARWHALRARLAGALADLSPDALDAVHQHPRRGSITGREILIVVARHAAEHLGQAELTRDLLRASREQ